MDWIEIEKKLGERGEGVCRHLLPKGKRVGAEFLCGSIAGEEGDSLRINLEGKTGVWADFAGDKRGKTLMSLWCSVRGRPFRECIQEAKQWLGIPDDYGKRVRSAGDGNNSSSTSPNPLLGGEGARREGSAGIAETWGKCGELVEGGPVWKYLVEERRLEPQVLGWFGVREMISNGEWVMVFPYYAVKPAEDDGLGILGEASKGNGNNSSSTSPNPLLGGEGAGPGRVPTWLKFEALKRVDGKKREWTTKGPEKCLWGMQLSSRKEFSDAKDLLITEGEKDALSWASYGCGKWGVLPVSVPFGAKWKSEGRPSPNREWLDSCWDWMQGFETVYVAMDGDEAGRRASADLITEIGPRRCRLVELPEKLLTTDGH